MVAADTADIVAAATAVTVADMADMATVADMDIASTPAAEATEGMVTAVDTGTDTAGEDTTAVVITGTIAGTGVAVVIMEAPTGAVRYSALDSAMFDQGRFAMTRTGIRYRVTCRHTVRTHTESAFIDGGC
jgi:hypothetical protein